MRFLLMLLLLNVAILIHEGFHYLAALACGIGVTEFSVGLGPSLVQFLLPDGATFHLRVIPFAGYVEPMIDGPNGLASAGFWPELLMYVSGMLGSVTVAFLYFCIVGAPSVTRAIPQGDNASFGKIAAFAFRLTFWEWISAPVYLLVELFRAPGNLLRSVQGPIGLLFGAPADSSSKDQKSESSNTESQSPSPGFRVTGFVSAAMYLCVALSAFNLLPIFPFDGGRILVLCAEAVFGQGLIVDILAYAGIVLAGLIILAIFAKDLVVLVMSKLRRK